MIHRLHDLLAVVEEENRRPGALVPILQRVQELYGYLPREVLETLARRIEVPLAQILGTATFYTQFRFTPVGRHVIRVCHGTACHIAGAQRLTDQLTDTLGIGEQETTEDGLFTLERVACLGCCSLAPVVMIGDQTYGNLTLDRLRKVIAGYRSGELPKQDRER
ncbi:MAG: NADH-quinone oxidoreductase subunit NuoE [Spirochaetota bacterium]